MTGNASELGANPLRENVVPNPFAANDADGFGEQALGAMLEVANAFVHGIASEMGDAEEFLPGHGAASVAAIGIEHVHDAGAQPHAAKKTKERTAGVG